MALKRILNMAESEGDGANNIKAKTSLTQHVRWAEVKQNCLMSVSTFIRIQGQIQVQFCGRNVSFKSNPHSPAEPR